MRKPAFCLYENKGTDQLCGYRTTDQLLCFRYIYLKPVETQLLEYDPTLDLMLFKHCYQIKGSLYGCDTKSISFWC